MMAKVRSDVRDENVNKGFPMYLFSPYMLLST